MGVYLLCIWEFVCCVYGSLFVVYMGVSLFVVYMEFFVVYMGVCLLCIWEFVVYMRVCCVYGNLFVVYMGVCLQNVSVLRDHLQFTVVSLEVPFFHAAKTRY